MIVGSISLAAGCVLFGVNVGILVAPRLPAPQPRTVASQSLGFMFAGGLVLVGVIALIFAGSAHV